MREAGEQSEGASPFGIFCVLPPCRLTAASYSIFSSNPRVCVSILDSSPLPYNRPLTCSQWRERGEPRGAFALKPRGHSPRADPTPSARILHLLLLLLAAQAARGRSLLTLRRKGEEVRGGPSLASSPAPSRWRPAVLGPAPQSSDPLACLPEGCFPNGSGLRPSLSGRWAGRPGRETGLEGWRLTWGHAAEKGWCPTWAKAASC